MTVELTALDREIAETIAERQKFGLASPKTCYEIEDRTTIVLYRVCAPPLPELASTRRPADERT